MVKSFKDRLRARLPVSVAEVGDVEKPGVATLGVAVVSGDSVRCHEILAAASQMGRVLPNAVLADVRTEVVPFGKGGRGVESGIEGVDLEAETEGVDLDAEIERLNLSGGPR